MHKHEWEYCNRGHPLHKTNTYVRPNGRIECRSCRALACRKYKQRKRKKIRNQDIRLIMEDQRTQREIAKDYGVCKSTIGKIKRGESWK